jgi:hypothetical protein
MEELLDLELAAMRELFPSSASSRRTEWRNEGGVVEAEAALLDKPK